MVFHGNLTCVLKIFQYTRTNLWLTIPYSNVVNSGVHVTKIFIFLAPLLWAKTRYNQLNPHFCSQILHKQKIATQQTASQVPDRSRHSLLNATPCGEGVQECNTSKGFKLEVRKDILKYQVSAPIQVLCFQKKAGAQPLRMGCVFLAYSYFAGK